MEGPEKTDDDLRYTKDEVAAALATLTQADISRLMQAAWRMAAIVKMSGDDLFQEAYLRALDSRSCKRGTGMPGFLRGIMRSVASEGPRARKKAREECGLEIVYLGNYGDPGMPDPESSDVGAEEAALAKVYYGPMVAQAKTSIADDYELQLLCEGLNDGMRGKELEELLGTDVKGLAAARKRLGGRLHAAFPKGFIL
jgi:DNA-directed RNA polymerase specialized sigma24 family protein